MPVVSVARFEVRPEAREQAERAMHELATYVRTQLPDSAWTTYRDSKAPTKYLSVIVADSPVAAERHGNATGTQAFFAALAPLLVGELELTHYELVTSSDLARRHRR
jgi:quinol monooxygenase YgiN